MSFQAAKAKLLHSLHHGPGILVLPNAWDCASARIFELAGFPAVATTSAGVAFAYGYPDGQRIPADEMLEAVHRIARSVSVPVTADLEAGYGDVAETTARLIASGAVGLNLEDREGDSLVDIDTQVKRIETVRRVGHELGVRAVINARTDLYLAQIGDPSTRFDHACERLLAYAEAGADCLFIPGIIDEELIRRFTGTLRFPVNILAVPGAPSIERLEACGVSRVSVGSGIARAAMGITRKCAEELKNAGTYGAMAEEAVPYAEANTFFA
jgi:2-methylisocitrate lyase-like PEP mutase family enzyme